MGSLLCFSEQFSLCKVSKKKGGHPGDLRCLCCFFVQNPSVSVIPYWVKYAVKEKIFLPSDGYSLISKAGIKKDRCRGWGQVLL